MLIVNQGGQVVTVKGGYAVAEDIMTVEECAKYLKTGVSTIYRLAREGKIPATKVGNQWRFRKERIDKWLDEQGAQKSSEPGEKERGKS